MRYIFLNKNKENKNRIFPQEIIGDVRKTYSVDNDIFIQLEKYQFNLALIFKFTYEIFHKNKILYDKASRILNEPSLFFKTNSEIINNKRKEHYDFYNGLDTGKLTHGKVNELFQRYNYILRDIFGFYPESSILINPFLSKKIRRKMTFFSFIYFIFKGYIKLYDLNDYELLFDKLEKEIQIIKPFILKSSNKYRDYLFEKFPQFKIDYPYLSFDSENKSPIICETEYGLAWTRTDGELAHYFKTLDSERFNDNVKSIENIFRIYDLKKKAAKASKDWYAMEKGIKNYHEEIENKKKLDSY